MTTRRPYLLTTLLLFAGTAVFATAAYAHHPGHGESFGHGLLHPFTGLDHLLAMVAVGILAARVSDGGRWLLPASFVGFMLVGSIIGLTAFGMEITAVEWVIAASVLVFGIMIFGLPRVPVAATAVIIAAFALFHGYAHVAGMGAATPVGYLTGMLLGTAVLHGVGLAAGLALERAGKGNVAYVRFSGAGVVVAFLIVILLGIGT